MLQNRTYACTHARTLNVRRTPHLTVPPNAFVLLRYIDKVRAGFRGRGMDVGLNSTAHRMPTSELRALICSCSVNMLHTGTHVPTRGETHRNMYTKKNNALIWGARGSDAFRDVYENQREQQREPWRGLTIHRSIVRRKEERREHQQRAFFARAALPRKTLPTTPPTPTRPATGASDTAAEGKYRR